ncbi:hypothetical protein [Archangium lansingense]|uniref:Uncharacterized protein n=1 Tax=Archangium lansingense TaxID=2995310 RepID=A0ABT4A4F4_9BACT|nr:hypothetical protein [Archangium lansinium]MCY1076531.1 hypothetical protein [Archangium lansinium]
MQKRGDRLPMTAALSSMLVTLALFGLGSVLWILWLFGGEALRTWQEMGWWAPVVVLVTGVSLMASLGALVLRGWKSRLPAAVFLALGLAPWLVGTLGARWGVRSCFEAIANVNFTDRITILGNGFSEALASYLFGGGLSVALLLGLAAGLGTAALVVASGRRASEEPSIEPGGPASAALLSLAAALAVGALLPSVFFLRNGFNVLANARLLDREPLLIQTVTSLGAARQFSRVALGVSLVLAVGTALWARRRPGMGLGRAVAAGLCVVPAFALHALTFQNMEHMARVAAATPWASAGDFQPVSVSNLLSSRQAPDALVTLTHLKPPEGAPRQDVPLEGALAPALRASLNEWQLEVAEVEDAIERKRLILHPTLSLAVDGRLDGAKLRGLVEAALPAGVRSIILVGQTPSSPNSALLESEPLMGLFTREMLATEPIALLSALPQGEPMEGGWDARLDANVLTLTPRPGSSEEPLTVDLSQPQPDFDPEDVGDRSVPIYLPMGEALTAERLVRISEVLSGRRTGRRVLLLVLLTEPLLEDAAPVADDGPR